MIGNKESPAMATAAGSAARLGAVLLLLFMTGGAQGAGPTVVGFYSASCPRAEAIIQATVQARFNSDKTITPALLRMFFHDCFVTGCDASLLLDSTPGNQAEKEASPNLTVRGFDLIDAIKEALEAACPGIVSCADIIAVAVRDSLVMSGGPNYDVPCGRKDSLTSKIADADALPSPSDTVDEVNVAFAEKGLTLTNTVALIGAHTVGVAHCGFFSDRIFSFHGSGAPDPTMNATLVKKLANICPNPFTTESTADPTVALDQGTVNVFDTSYFSQLLKGNGILEIDQELAEDGRTLQLVNQFRDSTQFFSEFVTSILLLGNLDVKTAAQGEVRRNCHKANGPNTAPPPKQAPTPPTPKPASPPPKPATPPPKTANPPPPKQAPPPPPPKLTSPPPKPTSPPPSKRPPPPPAPPKPASPPPPKKPKSPPPPPPKPKTPPPPPPKPASPPPKKPGSPPPPPPQTPKPPPSIKPNPPPPRLTSPPPPPLKPRSPPPTPPKPKTPPPPPPKPASPPPKKPPAPELLPPSKLSSAPAPSGRNKLAHSPRKSGHRHHRRSSDGGVVESQLFSRSRPRHSHRRRKH